MKWHPLGLVGFILLSGSVVLAGNWPSFRGESASGVGTGTPPVTWDLAKGTNVAWSAEIPGLGHSSPIFATPALDGNLLIVRTRGRLIALGTI